MTDCTGWGAKHVERQVRRVRQAPSSSAAAAVPAALADDDDDGVGSSSNDEPDDEAAAQLRFLQAEFSGDWQEDVEEAGSAAAQGSEERRDVDDMETMYRRFVAAAVEHRVSGEPSESGARAGTGPQHAPACAAEEDEDVLEELMNELASEGAAAGRAKKAGRPPARLPPPQLDKRAVDKASQMWCAAVQESVPSLQLMDSGQRSFEPMRLDTCLGNELSLIMHLASASLEVDFVTWVKPYNKMEGRVVQLDERDSVIQPSNFHKKRSFRGSMVVLPSAGARVRRSGRDHMAAEPLRLRSMWRACVDAEASLESMPCAGCSMTEPQAKQCPCCLLTWHTECGLAVRAAAEATAVQQHVATLRDLGLAAADLPFFFLSGPWADSLT